MAVAPASFDLSPDLYDWRDEGVCREAGPDLFFSDDPAEIEDAKRICRRCPVKPSCLDEALSAGETHGVWGGLNERERRKHRKELLAAGALTPRPKPRRRRTMGTSQRAASGTAAAAVII